MNCVHRAEELQNEDSVKEYVSMHIIAGYSATIMCSGLSLTVMDQT